ncbi:MAG: hypothetical protein IKK62_03360 [Bacteroidaceae bacterium]|nr:hypothetical protein [Bacteroidaceae bacterium]
MPCHFSDEVLNNSSERSEESVNVSIMAMADGYGYGRWRWLWRWPMAFDLRPSALDLRP